jgi:energy-converting hydrogenase Eha subunit F
MILIACSGIARYMEFIPTARVPILQYMSNHFGISCDVSINNYPGQIKSRILYWICTMDERFGDMVLLVSSMYPSDVFSFLLPLNFGKPKADGSGLFLAGQGMGKSSKY